MSSLTHRLDPYIDNACYPITIKYKFTNPIKIVCLSDSFYLRENLFPFTTMIFIAFLMAAVIPVRKTASGQARPVQVTTWRDLYKGARVVYRKAATQASKLLKRKKRPTPEGTMGTFTLPTKPKND